MEELDELRKELDGAFMMVAAMPVTGDAQERAVRAKESLRRAYELTEAIRKKTEERAGTVSGPYEDRGNIAGPATTKGDSE